MSTTNINQFEEIFMNNCEPKTKLSLNQMRPNFISVNNFFSTFDCTGKKYFRVQKWSLNNITLTLFDVNQFYVGNSNKLGLNDFKIIGYDWCINTFMLRKHIWDYPSQQNLSPRLINKSQMSSEWRCTYVVTKNVTTLLSFITLISVWPIQNSQFLQVSQKNIYSIKSKLKYIRKWYWTRTNFLIQKECFYSNTRFTMMMWNIDIEINFFFYVLFFSFVLVISRSRGIL